MLCISKKYTTFASDSEGLYPLVVKLIKITNQGAQRLFVIFGGEIARTTMML